jgi:hypothetical protein
MQLETLVYKTAYFMTFASNQDFSDRDMLYLNDEVAGDPLTELEIISNAPTPPQSSANGVICDFSYFSSAPPWLCEMEITFLDSSTSLE